MDASRANEAWPDGYVRLTFSREDRHDTLVSPSAALPTACATSNLAASILRALLKAVPLRQQQSSSEARPPATTQRALGGTSCMPDAAWAAPLTTTGTTWAAPSTFGPLRPPRVLDSSSCLSQHRPRTTGSASASATSKAGEGRKLARWTSPPPHSSTPQLCFGDGRLTVPPFCRSVL
ncbi:hypothetical protein BU26DRAFT_261629 [Trematosphaeria pertusa]|uniref:Uncharacterized protein n=1 Tax=Trematosphaeria pertusa TaxID=390896 RepID=A0A6A6IT00_9PLEO|nr:uncharacterized protein BU26DRAFT_261629 [Trematosphaeria pertusa]KAF2252663.1 hypothetical protein BU26DRAFT_261629 [Trematosphaeria pertusa]